MGELRFFFFQMCLNEWIVHISIRILRWKLCVSTNERKMLNYFTLFILNVYEIEKGEEMENSRNNLNQKPHFFFPSLAF